MDEQFLKIRNIINIKGTNKNKNIKKNKNSNIKEQKLVKIKYDKYHFETLESDIKSKIEEEWSSLFKKKINDIFISYEISEDDKVKMIKSIASSIEKLKRECGDRIIDIKKYLDIKDILQLDKNIYIPGLDLSRSDGKKPLTFKLPDVIGFSIDPKTREKNMLFISKLARDIMNLGNNKFSLQLNNFVKELKDTNIKDEINQKKNNYPIIKYWEIYSKLIQQISTGNIDINFSKSSSSQSVLRGGDKKKKKDKKSGNKNKKKKNSKKKQEIDPKTKELIKEFDRIRKFEECKTIEEKNRNNNTKNNIKKNNSKCEEQINTSINNFNAKGYNIFKKIFQEHINNTIIKKIDNNFDIVKNNINKIKEIYDSDKLTIENFNPNENEFIKNMKLSLIKNYFNNSFVNFQYQNRSFDKLPSDYSSLTNDEKDGIKKIYLIFDVLKYYKTYYKELKGDIKYKFFVTSIKQPSINDKYDIELKISRGLYVYLNVMYNELKLLLVYVNSKFRPIVVKKNENSYNRDTNIKKEKKIKKKEKKDKKKETTKEKKLSDKELFIQKLKKEIAEEKDKIKRKKKIKLLKRVESS